MNMLQRNPRDSKHREFHDGEYEYWPAKTSGSGGSTSFPAACLNGLGLVAALVASALLAAMLAMLYSQTSPQAIYEDFAIVNVNIYNNVENLDVRYTLSLASDPDTVLQEGALEYSEHTLNLQGLTPGTKYILQYTSLKDGEWKPIGDFQFTTPGDPPEQSEQLLTTPTEPTSVTEPKKQTELATEATEATTEATEATMETEEATETAKPPAFWRPPKTKPTEKPKVESATEPKTEHETEPVTEPPAPTALEPKIGKISYRTEGSGADIVAYYSFPQTFRFQNISQDEIREVKITRDDKTITHYTQSIDGNILSLTFNGSEPGSSNDYSYWIDSGETSSTKVTVFLKDGTYVEKTQDIVIPSITGVILEKPKITGNNYVFTIVVTTNSSDEGLSLQMEFYPYSRSAPCHVEIGPPEKDPDTGTITYTCTSTYVGNITEQPANAVVTVYAIWDRATDYLVGYGYQNKNAKVEYTP